MLLILSLTDAMDRDQCTVLAELLRINDMITQDEFSLFNILTTFSHNVSLRMYGDEEGEFVYWGKKRFCNTKGGWLLVVE